MAWLAGGQIRNADYHSHDIIHPLASHSSLCAVACVCVCACMRVDLYVCYLVLVFVSVSVSVCLCVQTRAEEGKTPLEGAELAEAAAIIG